MYSMRERPEPETAVADPHVSIVIPVYNEEGILASSIAELREKLKGFPWRYEILISENG